MYARCCKRCKIIASTSSAPSVSSASPPSHTWGMSSPGTVWRWTVARSSGGSPVPQDGACRALARAITALHPRLALIAAIDGARKEGFRWSDEAAAAFRKLQHALTAAPVLQLPDFNRDFIVECDASGTGLGAVLHQGGGPAFSRCPSLPR